MYVCRNVKDAAVSFYHHMDMMLYTMEATFDEYSPYFKNGEIEWGRYFAHLKVCVCNPFYVHAVYELLLNVLQEAWKYKDHRNLKFMWYEEMKKDLPKIIRELCAFTGHDALSEEKQAALLEHVSIENMRDIAKDQDFVPGVGARFFRKGKVGNWKEYFNGERLQEWDDWIKEELAGTDIAFPEH